jgi:hypothetical protein
VQEVFVNHSQLDKEILKKKKKFSPHRHFPDKNKPLLKEPPLYALLWFSFLVQEHLPLEKWIVH